MTEATPEQVEADGQFLRRIAIVLFENVSPSVGIDQCDMERLDRIGAALASQQSQDSSAENDGETVTLRMRHGVPICWIVWAVAPGKVEIVAICSRESKAKRYLRQTDLYPEARLTMEMAPLDHLFGAVDLRSVAFRTTIKNQETRGPAVPHVRPKGTERPPNAFPTPPKPSTPAQPIKWNSMDTAPYDGSEILLLAHDMVIQARYCPGEWSEDTPNGPPEYSGAIWSAFDDALQFEIEEVAKEKGTDLHGQVTGWLPLSAITPAQPTDAGEATNWRKLAITLAEREADYRKKYGLHGTGDMKTGRAWDKMRHASLAIQEAALRQSATNEPAPIQDGLADEIWLYPEQGDPKSGEWFWTSDLSQHDPYDVRGSVRYIRALRTDKQADAGGFRQGVESAAKVADRVAKKQYEKTPPHATALAIAAAIRALITEPKE